MIGYCCFLGWVSRRHEVVGEARRDGYDEGRDKTGGPPDNQ